MATQIDARVKQKTGTAADFAGFVLLEGEEARVRLTPDGPVWNTKTGPGLFDDLPYDIQLTGVPQPVDTSFTFPTDVPILGLPTEDGIYEGETVDLSAGITFLPWDGSTLAKVVYPINLAGYVADTDVDLGPDVNLADKSTFIDNEYVTTNGATTSDSAYVRTDFIKIEPGQPLSFRRGGQINVFGSFYETDDLSDWIENISAPSGTTGTVLAPVNAHYIRANVSNNASTREADKDAFMLSQTEAPVDYRPYKQVVRGIKAHDLPSVETSLLLPKSSVVAGPGRNIVSPDFFIDGSYITTSGTNANNSNYTRTDFIRLIPGNPLSYRRGSDLGTFGSFYSAPNTGGWLGNITGVSGLSGTLGVIPPTAMYIRANVSNNPATRLADKNAFMLSYTEEPVPYEPYEYAVREINDIPLPTVYPAEETSRWKGLRGIMIGDSITQPSDSFIIRALNKLGIEVVQNYGINGSTIARRAAQPTQRDPIVDRYADMTTDNIDLVIVSAGTNDCNYSWTPFGDFTDRVETTFLGAYHMIAEGLQNIYAGKTIMFINNLKRYDELPTPESTNDEGKTQKDYADAIKDVGSYWGIPVYDLYGNSILNAFIESHRTAWISDGTHPNATGHEIISRGLTGFINALR